MKFRQNYLDDGKIDAPYDDRQQKTEIIDPVGGRRFFGLWMVARGASNMRLTRQV